MGFWDFVKRAALLTLRAKIGSIRATDVPSARQEAERAIQSRRLLPGEVRRLLCGYVYDVRAATVQEFKDRLCARVEEAVG